MTGLLADTSVWIAHHRTSDPVLEQAIVGDDLWTHELIIAELALGSIPDRTEFLADIASFHRLPAHPPSRVIAFADQHGLVSSGIGYVDASLLVSLHHAQDVKLWTRDKKLLVQAERLGLAFDPG